MNFTNFNSFLAVCLYVGMSITPSNSIFLLFTVTSLTERSNLSVKGQLRLILTKGPDKGGACIKRGRSNVVRSNAPFNH